MIPLGSSPSNRWHVSTAHVDFTRPRSIPQPVSIAALPQNVTFDCARTALVIVDMQNDFCHPDGWLASIGVDVTPNRAPILPLARMIGVARAKRVPIVWVNWGNRPDLLNLGPSTLHVYNPDGESIGLGAQLANGAPVLERGSWAAAILDEFGDTSGDVHVAKYSMSGFWDTPLQSILNNLGLTTLLFGGVNIDQCVLATLQDASFRGFDCVLLEDCCATTSPDFCTQATLYNVRQCFGFSADGAAVADAIEALA